MNILEWEVENYKSIKSAQIEPGGLTVLIGKNNTGKSNLIYSLRDYYNDRVNFDSSVYGKDESNEIKFRIRIKLNKEEHSRSLDSINRFLGPITQSQLDSFRENEAFKIFEHEVAYDASRKQYEHVMSNWGEELKYIYKSDGIEDEESRTQSVKFSDSGESVYMRNNSGLSLIGNDGIGIRDGWEFLDPKRNVTGGQTPSYSPELANDGSNLDRVFHHVRTNEESTYNKISDSYERIMEGVNRIRTEILPSDQVTTYVEEDILPEGFTLNEISSGSREILILLTKIILARKSTDVLLIEEPELHLHPKAQRELFDVIQETVAHGTQIILGTHSAEFIDRSDMENIVMVTRNGASEFATGREKELDPFLTSIGYDKSDLLHSTGVVFVEGPTDKSVFEIMSETLDMPLRDSGIELIPRGEPGETEREIIDTLRRLSIPYMFVLDGHGSDPKEEREEIASSLGISPNAVTILQKYGIESYLKESPTAVAKAFDLDLKEVEEFIEENTTERNEKGALAKLYEDRTGQSYNKKNHGPMIALQFEEQAVPDEIKATIRAMLDLER